MKQKAFFIIFEGLSLKQIKSIFLKGESPTLILTLGVPLAIERGNHFCSLIVIKW